MPVTGLLSHLDISVGYPARSIAFYETFLTALGFRRTEGFTPEFFGDDPTRAFWGAPALTWQSCRAPTIRPANFGEGVLSIGSWAARAGH